MKIRLIIVVQHTTKVVVKKKIQAWTGDSNPSCVYGLSNIHLNWSSSTTLGARGFFLVGGDRIERRSQVAKRREKNIANSQNDQLLDGLIAQLVEDCIGIAQVKL